MPEEIWVGGVLLANVCEKCHGTGWTKTYWHSSKGGEMTLVEENICDDCKGPGLLLTDAGNEMRKFIELVKK